MIDRADEIAREVVLRVFGLLALEKPDESYRRKDEHDYFRVCAEHELALDAVKRFAPALRSYASELEAECDRLREALKEIAECEGKTLLGPPGDPCDRMHQVGAHKAFNQCAVVAKTALSAPTPEGGGG